MSCGLDLLRAEGFARLAGKRVGLLTHAAALSTATKPIRSALSLFSEQPGFELKIVFGPEHGLHSTAQDLIPVATASNTNAVQYLSLYGDDVTSLKPPVGLLASLGLDVLVVDLVDIGSRYYTFHATMLYCLQACAEAGVAVLVLDRPNPLGRVVEGPTIEPGFESFVGVHPLPIRHGLSLGELATLYRSELVPTVSLEVLKYDPNSATADWLLPPSPNMPSLRTATVYPGMCLLEGTNLSEGRGTTRPFEWIGFPGLDAEMLCQELAKNSPPGVEYLPVHFEPTFHKHRGQICGGAFLVPSLGFLPVRTGYHVLRVFRRLLQERFQWRTERYEFVDTIPAIDLLFGSARERGLIDADQPVPEAAWAADESAFLLRRKSFLIYS